MKTLVVVNPNASHGESGKDFETTIKGMIREKLRDFDLHVTTGQRDAMSFVSDHGDYERIISVGGDGTLNEVVNGIMNSRSGAMLGMIAVGSGNDFARSIDLTRDYGKMVDIACGSKARHVDLFEVRYRAFSGEKAARFAVNVVGTGFDAAVTNRMNRSRFKTSGKMAYLLSFLIEFLTTRTYRLNYTIDSGEFSDRYYFLTMGNGNYFGGGMRIAPNAVVDDGLIDIIGVAKMAKIRLLYHFPKIYKGEHLKIDAVCHHVSERISVSSDRDVIIQMDGEVVGKLPMEISVHKKTLCILSA